MSKRKRDDEKKQIRKRQKRDFIPIGVPQKHTVKLRWSARKIIDTGATTVATAVFRANSLFDPDYDALASNQPRYFDQWAAMYGNYTVIGSRMKIDCYYNSTTRTPVKVYYGLSKDATPVADYFDTMELKDVNSFFLTENGNQVVQTRSQNFSAKHWFKVKNVLDEGNLSAAMTANPASPAYFYVGCVSGDNLTDPAEVVVNVMIEYIAVLRSPVNVGAS